jgi:hypothetical protein
VGEVGVVEAEAEEEEVCVVVVVVVWMVIFSVKKRSS